jgi:hypothetical protein
MGFLRTARLVLLAAILFAIPASSFASVYISVGFAPPVLPVYVQPQCTEPGWIWTPGYWAYGEDGYYWVPGAWVPAPYEGALWTPPYWGWNEGVYVFHPGYWGQHVGYYGGVNYGFGYFGIGFVGGEWHGHDFAYNTAVVNVNRSVIRNVYVNKTVINNVTVVNNNHVAYAGGPGGIRHDPTESERVAMRERHEAPTAVQQQHFEAARTERGNYFKANNGHPQQVVVERPLAAAHQPAPGGVHDNVAPGPAGRRMDARPEPMPQPTSRPAYQQPSRTDGQPSHPGGEPELHNRPQPQPQYRPAPQPEPQVQNRPAPQPEPRGVYRAPQPQPQYRPEPKAQPQYRPAPQPRPEPEKHAAPEPQHRPAPQARPEAQSHAAPQAQPESRPQHESRPQEPHR